MEKQNKNSYLAKTEEQEKIEIPDYSDAEKEYLKNFQKKLEDTRDERDKNHPEFDGLDYISYWHTNEGRANTMLKGKKNRSDSSFQSGTLRHKMLAFLSSFQGLNLKGDISAFNESEVLINTLGNAMEDIIDKVNELDNDEEWRMIRQYEMLKHGYVFVEDMWITKWETVKKMIKGFIGKIAGVEWNTSPKKGLSRPRRSIIPGLSVYLGSMRKYMIEDQPFIFTVETKDYVELELIYKDWERWKYVAKDKRSFTGSMTDNNWVLGSDPKKGKVEIIRFQDKPHNEFQLILNGVPMLPMGFPLTEIRGDGEYTIDQQNLEPIRHDYAYGKSFIFKNKNAVAILDEMIRLAIKKTQKSYIPPYLNLSQRLITRDIFEAGKITRGVGKGEIVPVTDKEAQGVTAPEFGMIQETKKFVNEMTVSPTFTGTKEEGGRVTATQIIELQKQARMMMGLMTLAAALLEKKLTIKRLMLLLEKWFDPIDQTFNKSRNVLQSKYRYVSRFRRIEGEGSGIRMVIPRKNIPPSKTIEEVEESLRKEVGMPVRIIMLDPEGLKQARITWVANVNPKEKKSSEYSKLLFDEMIIRAMNLGLRLNPDYIEDRFAEVWDEDPAKMFLRGEGEEIPPPLEEAGAEKPSPSKTPAIKVPGPGQGETPKPIPQ